jgi:hypothetical protein
MPTGVDVFHSSHVHSKDTIALPVTWSNGIESWETLNTALNQAEAETDRIDKMEVM